MKILCVQHMACPIHNAGGETTAHGFMRAMVKRGHEVTVICRPHSEEANFSDYEYEGVKVVRCPLSNDQRWIKDFATEFNPNLLVTHLDLTTMTMQLSLDIKKPLAHLIHNTFSIPVFNIQPHKCQLAIFNSEWVKEASNWKGPNIVVHPVVEPENYRCGRGTKVTLVNPTPGKGADTFYEVSKLLPDVEFLCVKSVYGEQIAPPNINPLLHPNVETMEHTSDIREAFRKTKVILMPSEYESYGRVAVEGACAGIPTIAHPTPGLVEALGDAGIFIDRNDHQAYADEIEKLLSDEAYYNRRSELALKLAASLEPEKEFDRLESALLITARDFRNREEASQVKMWISDRRIGRRADGTLTDKMHEAITLVCAVGHEISEEEAVAAGFISAPAVRVQRELDTFDLTRQMKTIIAEKSGSNPAAEHPWESEESKGLDLDEDKSLPSPEENKARPKKPVKATSHLALA